MSENWEEIMGKIVNLDVLDHIKSIHAKLQERDSTITTQQKKIEELELKLKLPKDVYKAFDRGRDWDAYCRIQYPCDPCDETDIKTLQERLETAEKWDEKLTEILAQNMAYKYLVEKVKLINNRDNNYLQYYVKIENAIEDFEKEKKDE